MTYTPINWQNGDTITAEKLNKMDNGWGLQETQLFSETVTTEAGDYGNEGQLTYSSLVSSSELAVTFNGVDYQCPLIEVDGGYGYGGVTSELNYDFSVFPFALISMSRYGNIFVTQTAGTYAVAASAQDIEVSAGFNGAVNECLDGAFPMQCIPQVTTFQEMSNAADAGRMLYFYASHKMHIISSFVETESATAIQAVPEGVENVETYGFNDVDGTLVFDVFAY